MPINIDDLTLGQIKELTSTMSAAPQSATATAYAPWIGQGVFIQTVTWAYTGRLVAVTDREIVIEEAARIYDTGRFSAALRTGNMAEIEPFPDGQVIVTREGTEVSLWRHPLPREVK